MVRWFWLVVLLVFPLVAQAQQVTVIWDPPAPAQMPVGLVITGYQVQGCQVSSGQASCTPGDLQGASTVATVRRYVDTAVLVGQTYCYAVVTLAGQARSGSSATACITVSRQRPAPTILSVQLLPPGTERPLAHVRIVWSAPVFDVTTVPPGDLLGYEVWRRPGTLTPGSGWVKVFSTGTILLTWEDSAPLIGGNCYQVLALYSAASSVPSATSCTPVPSPLPGVPINVRASSP